MTDVLLVAGYVPPFTLAPRFIMNIRELYALDVEGRCGDDVDAEFGLSSRGSRTTVGTIAFADVGGIGGLDGDEIVAIEDRAESSSRLV